jgi:D-serine deaminase-like pyridoxal phosphate-dependent protein
MNIDDPDTPAVVIDLDIMERNLRPSAAMIRTSLNVFLSQEFSAQEE